ncbi:MAG TPA: pentapeptide repeat-containing protein [Rubrobacter sp.]|nr:pentapeptide repeat-containing protein [Rubrobacter sp.]
MVQEQNPQERARELIRSLVPDWRPTTPQVLWAVRITIALGVLIAIGYSYGITLWDWLQLLIVPAVIAGGGIWFNRQQQERQLQANREQQHRELEIADQRAQDDALQTYIDRVSHLLADKEHVLREDQVGDNLSMVVRAHTLTVLTRLDGKRRGMVARFLYELGLISGDTPIVDLRKADLSGANLRGANLRGANLGGAILLEADLGPALVVGASLEEAYLMGVTNLEGANLEGALLGWANLDEASLRSATLEGAYLLQRSPQ